MKRKGICAALLTGLLLLGCGGTEEALLENASDLVALSVDGEEISLREWNFYVRMNQMQWEKSYLESYGDEMWSLETGENGETLADELETEVLELVCEIHLLNQRAKEYGAALSEAEKETIRGRAAEFMEAYHEALLYYAGADEEFVYELLCENELSGKVAQASVADYEPELSKEEVRREGICYVLISTTGLRDEDGNLTPFSEEEVERRTKAAQELCAAARESGDLKTAAEALGLTPVESSMGRTNEYDGQEPRMLDAARELEVGEISDPIETEEGFFLVQHTSEYDEEGTEYWREYLTELSRAERFQELYGAWREAADIVAFPETMEEVEVKKVLKELL